VSGVFQRWFTRVKSEPQVLEAVDQLKQYVEQRFLEKEIVANTGEQAVAFREVLEALGEVPNAVVLVGNMLIARHTPPGGTPQLFAQSLSAEQLRRIQANPGILASPENVLAMMALAMADSAPASVSGSAPPKPSV